MNRQLRRHILAVLIIVLLFAYGCATNEAPLPQQSIAPPNNDVIQPRQQQSGQQLPQQRQPPPECIGKSATDPQLPESCTIWFSQSNLPVNQGPGNKCPDGDCDEVEIKEGFCPQDCEHVQGWQNRQPSQPLTPQQPLSDGPPKKELTVTTLQSNYKVAFAKPSGWFKTGQDADIIFSAAGFDNTGGPLQFNHPGGVATDGVHLIMADRFNNRILLWNSLPVGNTPPDIVLGQQDFITNKPGSGLDQLNWPVSVATDGKKLVVADTYNDRLLIWNSFPLRNGQPADIEIKDAGRQNTNPKRKMGWPWAVWTDGKKLIAAATASSTVLIWNSMPVKSNQAADISIALPESFGTPRTIGSDGNHLIVGDHNVKVKGKEGQGNFFWKSFPTKDNQPYDFLMVSAQEPPKDQGNKKMMSEIFWSPIFTPDGKLIALGERLYIWNSFPQSEQDLPDLSVGAFHSGMPGYKFVAGDGSGAAIAGNALYLSLYNGNKMVGFSSLPQSSEQKPDVVIGSPDIDSNSLDNVGFITNGVIAADGKSLFISSDFDSKLSVWKQIPDESGAKPDVVYNLDMSPWDSELFENKLILAGKDKVYVWNNLPLHGEYPEVKLEKSIGSIVLTDIKGVAMDRSYFYLSDANKVYVWEELPSKNTNPKFTIDAPGASRLTSDGKYLVVASTQTPSEQMIKIYRVEGLSSSSKPMFIRNVWLNLPAGVLAESGHLFIADTVNNRVLVWKSIDDAVAGKLPEVVLGEENIDDTVPEIGRDKLFWPAGLAFDGSYLWVGEFKFSGRILRFSVGT